MSRPRPLWRQAFDAVERRVAGPAERTVRTDAFNDVLTVAIRSSRAVQRAIERRSRRVLHLANLPTATDVKRLAEQNAQLHREIRELQRRLDGATTDAAARRRPGTRG
jgi:hypothetical protein